jgi:hypothetical protein
MATLAQHCAAQIDDRIAAIGADKPIFSLQDHTTPEYVRSATCWLAQGSAVDATPLSPWNSNAAHVKAGILVSPRHGICAAHFALPVGATVRFVAMDGTVVNRTITATATPAGDLSLFLLDSDVPAGIGFAKVLPADWRDYISRWGSGIPALSLDYEEKALVVDLWALNSEVRFQVPTDATRLAFYEALIGGDSGNPWCLLVNEELVLLGVATSPLSGTSLHWHVTAVNAAMTALGGGYQLTELDLTAFDLVAEPTPTWERGLGAWRNIAMADLLHHDRSGRTLSAVIFNPATSQVWKTAAVAGWVDLDEAVFADCLLPLTETAATGVYRGDMPTDIVTAGDYPFLIFSDAANSFDDAAEAQGVVEWTGEGRQHHGRLTIDVFGYDLDDPVEPLGITSFGFEVLYANSVMEGVNDQAFAIKAKTDNLPASPASESTVAAVKAKTDNLPGAPAAVGSAMTLANGAITSNAIAAGALDGKGNWVLASSYTAPPSAATIISALLGTVNGAATLAQQWAHLDGDVSAAGGTITPLAATQLSGFYTSLGGTIADLTMPQNGTAAFVFAYADADGDPISLAGKLVRFVVHDGQGAALFQVDTVDGGVVIGGASNNQVTATITTPDSDAARSAFYKLWNVTDRALIASGKFTVRIAPLGT